MRRRRHRLQLGRLRGGTGGAHRLVGATGAQETVATSLTRGGRPLETPSALGRRQELWWGPSPGGAGGVEGVSDRIL